MNIHDKERIIARRVILSQQTNPITILHHDLVQILAGNLRTVVFIRNKW